MGAEWALGEAMWNDGGLGEVVQLVWQRLAAADSAALPSAPAERAAWRECVLGMCAEAVDSLRSSPCNSADAEAPVPDAPQCCLLVSLQGPGGGGGGAVALDVRRPGGDLFLDPVAELGLARRGGGGSAGGAEQGGPVCVAVERWDTEHEADGEPNSGGVPPQWLLAAATAAQGAVGTLATTVRRLNSQLQECSRIAQDASNRAAQCSDETKRDQPVNYLRDKAQDRVASLRGRLSAFEKRKSQATAEYDQCRAEALRELVPRLARQLADYEKAYNGQRAAHAESFEAVEDIVGQLYESVKGMHLPLPLRQALPQHGSGAGHCSPVLESTLRFNSSTTEYSDFRELSTLRGLYDAAAAVLPRLQELAVKVAAASRGKAVVPPVKGVQRALEKSMEDYGGDYTRLLDLARASVECPDPPALAAAVRAIARDPAVRTYRIKNRFSAEYDAANSGGYRDLVWNLSFADQEDDGGEGHICELQLHLAPLARIKFAGGHRAYRAARALGAFAAENYEHAGTLTETEVRRISSGELRTLALSGSPIPSVLPLTVALSTSGAHNLVRLEMRGCSLSVPLAHLLSDTVCDRLLGLRELDLAVNRLSGEVPASIGKLTSLEKIWLNGNRLTGQLPGAALGRLRRLRSLRVYENRIEGGVPPELAALPQLEKLILHNNLFSGALPGDFAEAHSLEMLTLGNNRLTFIPPGVLSLPQLHRLELKGNDPAVEAQLHTPEFESAQQRFGGGAKQTLARADTSLHHCVTSINMTRLAGCQDGDWIC
eukprot:TRINITY_DN6246_c0_g2_i1.p1 TRINITY_DN6246_c0_g2~~TRINITY_DN6246_c0_g2_i1.p1  ORF type:complete len:772 (+),score=194.74 TRINITY_DN6246_c0_g2_i1:67-2382(+)